MTIGVFERGGLFLCPRLLDGAVPIWRATRGACCTYCVQCCVHGSSSTFDTWCSLGSCFCSIDVESRLGHVINSKQPPCAPTRKISHTRTRTERERACGVRDRARPSPRDARETYRKHDTKTMNQKLCTTETMLNGACKCQFKWQVPKTRTLALCARAHRHTQLHTERRHTQIAQITVTERARLRSSVG